VTLKKTETLFLVKETKAPNVTVLVAKLYSKLSSFLMVGWFGSKRVLYA